MNDTLDFAKSDLLTFKHWSSEQANKLLQFAVKLKTIATRLSKNLWRVNPLLHCLKNPVYAQE